jgi:hypothetical protein
MQKQESVIQQLRRSLRKRSFVILSILLIGVGILGVMYANLAPNQDLFSSLSKDIGIALFTTGLISIALEYRTREEYLEEMIEALAQALKLSPLKSDLDDISKKMEYIENLILVGKDIEKLGIRRIYKDRANITLDNVLEDTPSGGEIRLIGVSLKTFTGANSEMILKRKLLDGCKVKALVMDPKSDIVRQRAMEEKQDYDWLQSEISSSIAIFKNLVRDLPKEMRANIELGLYSVAPSHFILSTGKKMIISPYLAGSRGYFCPHLEFDIKEGGLHQVYLAHFDFLWQTKLPA